MKNEQKISNSINKINETFCCENDINVVFSYYENNQNISKQLLKKVVRYEMI